VNAPAADSEYLTPGEVARLLHVSTKTVNRWTNDGRIACIVTLGGHRRFRRSDVLAVAARMAEKNVPPPGGRGKPSSETS
jgi:excisionase family DNA binding protein